MDRQSKRSAAQERLRGSFLSQVGPQLQEYAVLLSEDGDEALESVVAELNRIARTSGALGLEVRCAASEEASVAVSKGQGAVGLVAIARAIRLGSPRFCCAPCEHTPVGITYRCSFSTPKKTKPPSARRVPTMFLARQSLRRSSVSAFDFATSASSPSVCIFLIEGTQVARARWGKAASNMALRMVADGLNAGLRPKDLVGQVDGDTFLIGFQGCSERVARSRMVNVSRGIQLRLHGDHRLREVLCLFGLADTEVCLTGLVTRADEDLRSVRRTST